MNIDALLDRGLLPSPLVRVGIRSLLRQRLSSLSQPSLSAAYASKMAFVASLRSKPIAVQTEAANEQHYEVGTGILQACLGTRMKYSSCLYPTGNETLEQAEVEMLELSVERAGVEEGMRILDLGCGWGSLSIHLAERFPRCNITALSNSRTQKIYIDSVAESKGLNNLTVVTGNIVDFDGFEVNSFDRIMSVELFEHMKNYELLLEKLARWLKPKGKLFVHIFANHETPYEFEDGDGWMSKYFFSGGTMPSADLLLFFQKDLCVRDMWWVNGKHYAKTCEDWLSKMTASKKEIWPHLEKTYGKENAAMWFYRWQIFYMACAELFAYNGGDIWGVCHYLFEKP